MPCSTRSFVSCNGEGGRLELDGTTVMCRAWWNTTNSNGSGKWRPYQETQGEEASSMVKSTESRCTGSPVIPRRSFVWRQQDLVVDENDALEHKMRQDHVSEVHEGEGEVPVQTRGGGEVRAYRQW
jgi:hypothetical protein